MSHLLGVAYLLAEEGGKTETPNSWLPESYEIIWGSIATFIIAAALWKLAVPQLRKALTARTARIQRDLDESAQALTDAQASAMQIRANMGDLAAERTRLLAEADRTAERVLTEGRARIEAEAAAADAKAVADIASARGRVEAELQAEVASLSAVATEDAVRSSLDGALMDHLIEDFIAKVGASR